MRLPYPARFLLAALCALPAPSARAQDAEVREAFARLMAAGEHEQIPWMISFSPPRLRMDQRLRVGLMVTLRNSDLNRYGSKHDLLLMVRLGQAAAADWLPGIAWVPQPIEEPLAKGTDIEFQIHFLAKPADLRVGIVLLDSVTGHSSVTIRPLRVAPLRSDPLPLAYRDLPVAEFASAFEGLEEAFLADTRGKLWLPLQPRRTLNLEVLVNFSHSDEFRAARSRGSLGSRGRPAWLSQLTRPPTAEDNLRLLLAALKPWTELASPDGVRITGLDLLRRRVVCEKGAAAALDWPRLRDALADFKPNVVSTETLLGQKEGADFFRQILRQRLAATGSPPPASSESQRPLRVFVLLSSAMLLPEESDLSPIEPEPGCRCRFYFIRLHTLGNEWDDLSRILSPLKPRRFDVRTAQDYRRALAAILRELNELKGSGS